LPTAYQTLPLRQMKIHRDIDNIPRIANAVVTTGTFDGVHPGHRAILSRLNKTASDINGESVLITFFPHPRTVINPDFTDLKLLNTQKEKETLLAKTGLDHLIVIPFTKEFSQITAEEYIKNILVDKIGTKKLVIGYDHRFGKGRGGSFRELQEMAPELGFDVEEISALEIDGVAVSSTKIRQALSSGGVDEAADMLGYDYPLTGIVIHGDQLGRTLGFPTANLSLSDPLKLIPSDGIYAVYVEISGKRHHGMLHIGPRRTLNDPSHRIEVNILNYTGDLYGQEISLFFVKKLRDEMKFESLSDLINQMESDKLHTERIFDSLEK
jgi:riboflavin kinase/FMN adenylyltransferase